MVCSYNGILFNKNFKLIYKDTIYLRISGKLFLVILAFNSSCLGCWDKSGASSSGALALDIYIK